MEKIREFKRSTQKRRLNLKHKCFNPSNRRQQDASTIVPFNPAQDDLKTLHELSDEVFAHTASKVRQNAEALSTLFEAAPMSFSENNRKVRKVLYEGNICFPEGASSFEAVKRRDQWDRWARRVSEGDEESGGGFKKAGDEVIRDISKLSLMKGAYQTYKKQGWRATFLKIKDEEMKKQEEREKIVEFLRLKQQEKYALFAKRKLNKDANGRRMGLQIPLNDLPSSPRFKSVPRQASSNASSQSSKSPPSTLPALKVSLPDQGKLQIQVPRIFAEGGEPALPQDPSMVMLNKSQFQMSQMETPRQRAEITISDQQLRKQEAAASNGQKQVKQASAVNLKEMLKHGGLITRISKYDVSSRSNLKQYATGGMVSISTLRNHSFGTRNFSMSQNKASAVSFRHPNLSQENPSRSRFNRQFLEPTPSLKDPSIQERLKRFPQIKAKFNQDQADQKKEAAMTLVGECKKEANQEIKKQIKRAQLQQLQEQYMYEQFGNTVGLLRDLDYADNRTIKPLYNYQLNMIKENLEQAQEVVADYREGLHDPSRDAAKLEMNFFMRQQKKRPPPKAFMH